VFDQCTGPWAAFCDVRHPDPSDFLTVLREYPFLLCVHGGGIDPSPKAWMALLSGVIPVMQRYPGVEPIYKDLPVVWVDDWNATALSVDQLQRWRESLHGRFDDVGEWSHVFERMQASYWAKLVAASWYTSVGYGYVDHGAVV
jgi:hypothetical protein